MLAFSLVERKENERIENNLTWDRAPDVFIK